MILGFWKGISNNFQELLQPKYIEPLYEPVFKYNRITPRSYIIHFESNWVILDELQINKMNSNYKRDWETDEHFTTFSYWLDRE